ncbi:short-chain dehydrogenase [Prauserella marina]|uniref:3-oxoacyl-[acyl-carrier protein] reductase/meso-butanediol dehydrogenase / (S,S)-butanediol dehydrogenase / diacetyl reductase n=1 Tax=Prauserella marina TaxID=530584 RepID=A0A222VRA5_9PSEU|nr:SDR family NAD(P)-dependent oxidoreductase [Prauserella marina]ASR36273.1 short-chain dehydrogenase [Prauserella marina]PWV77048.1 3-oxoacyl-[acyl-carrier protein] reductase/meso-butanediol dehydrogenase/(S,S)-butanediol dehydrogenase/diacetyl reductase [Prauserella marina]SDD03182.1 3-oxoacyl-[acyl-carrier protein] reductase/meso-butanediol dehydrogenase / (S,S)-butanediol dehydrogenase / diacetyl reductase [Prauserella marina]
MVFALTGLDDKVAVVTGAGRMRSIGRAVALALARAGCDIVLTGTGRDPFRYPGEEREAGWRDIESVAAEIRSAGRRAVPVVCDVSSESSVDALLAETLAAFGTVDVVVNNAAAARESDRKPVIDVDAGVWDTVLATNLRGTFLMSKAFGRRLIAQGKGGCVVNMSSIGGKLGSPGSAAYSASKAAVQSLTASTAREWGRYGIRVNAVCPGVTGTGRLDDLPEDHWRTYVDTQVPLRRAGKPEEVADAVVFLASDQACWVTGQAWNVDGGQLTVR